MNPPGEPEIPRRAADRAATWRAIVSVVFAISLLLPSARSFALPRCHHASATPGTPAASGDQSAKGAHHAHHGAPAASPSADAVPIIRWVQGCQCGCACRFQCVANGHAMTADARVVPVAIRPDVLFAVRSMDHLPPAHCRGLLRPPSTT